MDNTIPKYTFNNMDVKKPTMNDMESLEELVKPTTWTEKDTDIIVQYIIDEELGLESVDELVV